MPLGYFQSLSRAANAGNRSSVIEFTLSLPGRKSLRVVSTQPRAAHPAAIDGTPSFYGSVLDQKKTGRFYISSLMTSEDEASTACAGSQWACLNLSGLPLYLSCVFLAVICLIHCLEQFHHYLHAKAHPSKFWSAYLQTMDSELVVLGTISFVLFAVSSSLSHNAKSEDMEHWMELIEFVHMALFIMMVVYYSQIGFMAYLSDKYLTKLKNGSTAGRACSDSNTSDTDVSPTTGQPTVSPTTGQPTVLPTDSKGQILLAAHCMTAASESVRLGIPFFAMKKLTKIAMPGWEKVVQIKRGELAEEELKELEIKRGKARKVRVDVFQTSTVHLLWHAFLCSQSLPVDLPFDYIEYINRVTTHAFVKMIKVGWRVWMIFMGGILVTAAAAGTYHKVTGTDDAEKIADIFTDDPNNNQVVYFTFFYVIWVIMLSAWFVLCTRWGVAGTIRRVVAQVQGGEDATNSQRGEEASLEVSLLAACSPTADAPGASEVSWHKLACRTVFPCCSRTRRGDLWRNCWMFSAPDLPLRACQLSVLFFSLFVSLFTLTLYSVDSRGTFYTALITPFLLLAGLGGTAMPRYCSVRYFGTLAHEEILKELVAEAKVKWEAGGRRVDLEDRETQEAMHLMYEVVVNWR